MITKPYLKNNKWMRSLKGTRITKDGHLVTKPEWPAYFKNAKDDWKFFWARIRRK